MIALLLLACGPVTLEEAGPLELSTWTTDTTGSGGVLIVQTRAEQGLSFDLPVPEVEGLTFTPQGEPTQERLGGHTVITQRLRYTGKKGAYEIPALVVTSGETEAKSDPLWVDLGVEAPNVAELGDIVEPDALWGPIPTWIYLTLAGVLLSLVLGVAGLFSWIRRVRNRPKIVVVIPPDIRALDAWAAVKADPALTDEDKASQLSNIFRAYTEEVLAFPATAWTTTDIVGKLDGMVHLPEGNVPRAKRLLQATDLIKYAEEDADGGLLTSLDADLRAFIGGTRPRGWTHESEEAAE